MKRLLSVLTAAVLLPSLAWPQSFGQNKVQYATKDWKYIQSEHLDIYFYEGGEQIANFASAVAESALVSLQRTFQFELIARIPFLVYNSHNDFQETNVTPGIQPESVGGFTEFFKGRIVLPYEGSNELFRHVVHHELLHAVLLQYFYGAGAGAVIRGITRFQLPLWLNEGLGEYESQHWDTNADNMIRDAVINDYLPPLSQLEYMAYQGGQSFYYWIERRYGRAKVTELLQELRTTRNVNVAFQNALGENLEVVSEQWQKTLKQWYWPEIERRQTPTDLASALTDHRKTSNYINNSPSLSPDGSRLAYLTDRSGLFDIHLLNAITGQDMGKLVSGQKQSGVEELKWLRPGISWAPDNNRLVFAAKSGWQDVLHVVDVQRRRIVRTYKPGFEGIWNPSWSPDGKHIAFTGMTKTRCDLYLVDVETEQLTQITDDEFSDFEPTWSPDGRWLAFSSDRGEPGENGDVPIWQHDYRNSDIYLIRPDGTSLQRITSGPSTETAPEFYHSADTLLYLSDRNGISNVYFHVLSTGEELPLTNMLVGIQQISIANSGQRLAFTSFYRGGYDVYLWRNPLEAVGKHAALTLTDAMKYRATPPDSLDAPQLASLSNEQTQGRPYQSFAFDRDFTRGIITNGTVTRGEIETPKDNLQSDGSFIVRDYKPRFSIDYVGGVTGYDPFFGLQGLGQMYLSDLTGNHQIGIGAYLNRSIANSDFALSYMYQGWRPNVYFAFGQQVSFYLSDLQGDFDLFGSIERFRFISLLSGVSYPFSRFDRIDFSAAYLYTIQDNLTYIDIPSLKSSAAIFSLEYTRDNTRWGYYGPDDNRRSSLMVSVSPGIGSIPREFATMQADFRRYKALSREWSLAWRLAGGASFGKQPQHFILGGIPNWLNREFARGLSTDDINDLTFSQFVYPVRGTNYYEQIGTRYALLNAEIRFPFIRFLLLQAPIPLFFQQVRGAIFFDAGSAWDESSGFRLFKRNRFGERVLDDVLAGFGYGIRFYSPIGLLRIDAAWNTDLQQYTKPRYLFSLGTDF
ncbi:MAG: Protein TolB [bacterium]|nr:Protein TolB [bacterium]